MSLLTMVFPFQATMPAVETVASAAVERPLFSLAVFAAMLMLKPLLTVLLRRGLFVRTLHAAPQQGAGRPTLENVEMLNNTVRELETSQPNLAAELRSMAARS